MITPTQIYFIAVADRLQTFAVLVSVLTGITAILCLIFGLMLKEDAWSDDDDKKKGETILRIAARFGVVTTIAATIGVLCPSTRDVGAMIVVPKIANSETVSELGEGVKRLAIEWLDELKPKKEATK